MIWRIFLLFLGLDVGVSQEVELEEEGEDGGGRESEAAGTSEDVMRRKQELKLDLGPDYVFLFSLNSLRFFLASETDKKKKLIPHLFNTGPKMFCYIPIFLGWIKNWIAFSSAPKNWIYYWNQLLVLRKKFRTGTICKWIFGLAQKIWNFTKCFGTCKRTRHK